MLYMPSLSCVRTGAAPGGSLPGRRVGSPGRFISPQTVDRRGAARLNQCAAAQFQAATLQMKCCPSDEQPAAGLCTGLTAAARVLAECRWPFIVGSQAMGMRYLLTALACS